MAAVALLLVVWQASPARAQVAGLARVGAVPVAPDAGVGGPVSLSASSPIVVSPAAHEDSSAARSNVRQHVVLGALLGFAAGVALESFAYQRCAAHSPQSDRQACAIIVVVGVPVVGLASFLGGYVGWRTVDHPHATQQN